MNHDVAVVVVLVTLFASIALPICLAIFMNYAAPAIRVYIYARGHARLVEAEAELEAAKRSGWPEWTIKDPRSIVERAPGSSPPS